MIVQSLLSGLVSIIIVFLILFAAFVALVWMGFFPSYREDLDQFMNYLLGNDTVKTSSWPADKKNKKKKKTEKKKTTKTTKQKPTSKQHGTASATSSQSSSGRDQGDSTVIQHTEIDRSDLDDTQERAERITEAIREYGERQELAEEIGEEVSEHGGSDGDGEEGGEGGE